MKAGLHCQCLPLFFHVVSCTCQPGTTGRFFASSRKTRKQTLFFWHTSHAYLQSCKELRPASCNMRAHGHHGGGLRLPHFFTCPMTGTSGSAPLASPKLPRRRVWRRLIGARLPRRFCVPLLSPAAAGNPADALTPGGSPPAPDGGVPSGWQSAAEIAPTEPAPSAETSVAAALSHDARCCSSLC